MLRCLLMAAGLLLALPLAAADKLPMYDVEVLVFSRPSANVQAEHWPDRSELLREDNMEARTLGATTGEPFGLLSTESLQLTKEYARLATVSGIEPIIHLGWVQPGLTRQQSVPVYIEGRTEAGGNVDGTLRIILSRYLHVEADLRYQRPEDLVVDTEGDIFQAPQPLFRLKESRRMRSKEVHYLDHPLFGVVILITPRPS